MDPIHQLVLFCFYRDTDVVGLCFMRYSGAPLAGQDSLCTGRFCQPEERWPISRKKAYRAENNVPSATCLLWTNYLLGAAGATLPLLSPSHFLFVNYFCCCSQWTNYLLGAGAISKLWWRRSTVLVSLNGICAV
jgi:hypothetical protein